MAAHSPTSFANRIGRAVKSAFGYDAVESTNKRKPQTGKLLSEEDELPQEKRRRLVSGIRDLNRNFALASWAIRKHLDFVTTMRFRAKTPDKEFNTKWEERMRLWGHAATCDASGRHPFRRMIRLSEAVKTVVGDNFLIKLADRTLFCLEGDRVRDPMPLPDGFDRKRMQQGVHVDARGRALAYAVHNRKGGGGFEFDRLYPAESVIHHAWWDRFDQTRGVSPIASAFNTYQDVYESADFALAKMKVAQMFGLVMKRDSANAPGPTSEAGSSTNNARKKFNIDFGKGPVLLDLNTTESAEFLENKTPSAEFREFMQVMISIAMKSLDLPYTFYDESFTNFFGSKSALQLYIKSCDSKQDDLRCDVLRPVTLWNLTWDVADGALTLPAGIKTVEECQYEWVAAGVPWWNPAQEVNGDVAAVEAGFKTRASVVKERTGEDFFDVIDGLALEEQYMQEKGVTITRAAPTIYNAAPIVKGKDDAED